MSRVDVAKDYLVSVAERTVGIRGYRESLDGYIAEIDSWQYPPSEEYRKREMGRQRITSGLYAVVQIGIPALARSFLYYVGNDVNKELYPTIPKDPGPILGYIQMGSHLYSSLALDFGMLYLAIQASQNPAEIIALKLAANAATHVALDLGGEAIKRIKTFRPSATILTT